MGQLNFAKNFVSPPQDLVILGRTNYERRINIFAFNFLESISFKTINFCFNFGSNDAFAFSLSLGLYSLNGSTLSLANSLSQTYASTFTSANNALYLSMTNTSATQNITPGTWYFGMLVSTGGNSLQRVRGQLTVSAANAFPGGVIGGQYTASTTQLLASIATSDLDTIGQEELSVPYIILSA